MKFTKLLCVAMILALIVTAVSACGAPTEEPTAAPTESNEPTATTETTAPETDAPETEAPMTPEDSYIHVGATAESDELRITYLASGEYTPDNEFDEPEEGNKIIFLKFALENISGKSVYLSTFSFNCNADGEEGTAVYVGDGDTSASMLPGYGAVVHAYYEIPAAAQHVDVEYTYGDANEGQLIFSYDGEREIGTPADLGKAPSANSLPVGSTVTVDGYKLTYQRCEMGLSDDFFPAAEGNQLVAFYFEVENVSDSETSISSVNFDCFADHYLCKVSYAGEDRLGATMAPGESTSGCVVFEVPADASCVEAGMLDLFGGEEDAVFVAD